MDVGLVELKDDFWMMIVFFLFSIIVVLVVVVDLSFLICLLVVGYFSGLYVCMLESCQCEDGGAYVSVVWFEDGMCFVGDMWGGVWFLGKEGF